MPVQKVAFFGATGDCAGYTLANSLNAGLDCVALARTPEKLSKSMKDKGVSDETISKHLTIVAGDAKDVEATKTALQINGQVVDTIVSGIGSTSITFAWSIWMPLVLTDPTICRDCGNTLLKALKELKPAKKPLLINISTTGIQPKGKPRDVPLAYYWLYHYLLKSPHIDKEALEHDLRSNVALPENERSVSAFICPKPTLLFDGESLGMEKVKEGVEDSPAIGYTIRRKDVGLWIYERLLNRDAPSNWLNKSVTLCY